MNFFELLKAAINDITEHGYDSQERLDMWVARIKEASEAQMVPYDVMVESLRGSFTDIYKRLVESPNAIKLHGGVSRFALDKVKPQLRAELDRRIMASAQLIKLNREQMITRTLQRFSGWATSIPAGGSDAVDKREEKAHIKKSLASMSFEERRVMIDQGHKLTSAINETIAVSGGAIAAMWRSRWRQAGYNYREDHKERDGKVYAIRGNWALDGGLMKVGEDGYTDQITTVGEEPFCRCQYRYLFALRDLPDTMLTIKGRDSIVRK